MVLRTRIEVRSWLSGSRLEAPIYPNANRGFGYSRNSLMYGLPITRSLVKYYSCLYRDL